MNKIDDAWAVLKTLQPHEQELAAEAILDYASRAAELSLSREPVAEIQGRLDKANPRTLTPAELRARIFKA